MVQRDQLDTYWGSKTVLFKSRRRRHPWSMAAAPVESCQSVALRSPWGRFGSVLYMVSRLHRIRCRFQHISANSLISAAHKTMNSLAMASRALGGPKNRRMRYRRLPTTRPTPRGLRGPIYIRKKCVIWTRSRPVPCRIPRLVRIKRLGSVNVEAG